MSRLRLNGRACVTDDISLEPYTTLLKGEQGTIIYVESDSLGVYMVEMRMDTRHKGLDIWDNVAHLVIPELTLIDWITCPHTGQCHCGLAMDTACWCLVQKMGGTKGAG